MNDERLERRSHRRALVAVLGSTAAIALGGSLLTAPAAEAGTLSGLVGSVTAPVVGTVQAVAGSTGAGGVTAPVAATVGSVTTTAGAVTESLTAPVAGAVTGLTTPITSSVVGTTAGTGPTTGTGTGTGLLGTSGTSGLVDVSTGSGGVSIGVLGGSAVVSAGTTPTSGPTAAISVGGTPVVSVGTGTPSAAPTAGPTATTPPAVPVPASSTPSSPAHAPASGSSTPTTASPGVTISTSPGVTVSTSTSTSTSTSGLGSTAIATLQLTRSVPTVYPAPDGYLDSVRFGIRGLAADGRAVAVVGTAVLQRAGTTVRTWQLDGSTAAVTWNGRVGGTVVAGTFVLTVTAASSDGIGRTATSAVRVSAQHLTARTVSTKPILLRTRATAAMPKAVREAAALAPVTLRLRTVAQVHGATKLVLRAGARSRSFTLRSGTRTTAATTVAKASKQVTITRSAKPGTRPVSVRPIWTYEVLVG